eukprot:m.239358 g.239358  ORF g.239358 m.239358 type:complete len:69 (+) comp40181_c2_seq20:17601-17807(+)
MAWRTIRKFCTSLHETAAIFSFRIKEALEDFCNSKLKGLGNIPAEMKVRHFLNCWGMTVEHQASLKTQ